MLARGEEDYEVIYVLSLFFYFFSSCFGLFYVRYPKKCHEELSRKKRGLAYFAVGDIQGKVFGIVLGVFSYGNTRH